MGKIKKIVKVATKGVGYTVLVTTSLGIAGVSYTFYNASKQATKITLNTSGESIERNISILDANDKPLVKAQKQTIFEPAILDGENKNVPDLYIKGLVAVEDSTFFSRSTKGYSIKGLANAVLSKAKSVIFHTQARGGSTIDQQLVKNVALGGANAPETLTRKQIELIDSHYVADKYSRNDILASYINTLALYPDSVGAVSAYKDIFGESMPTKDTYLPENLQRIAFIVGLGQAPTTYIQQFETLGKERTKTVLGVWKEAGIITNTQYQLAIINLPKFKLNNKTSFSVAREYQPYVTEVQQEISKLNIPENSEVVIKTYAQQEQLQYLNQVANFQATPVTSAPYQNLPNGALTGISVVDTKTGHILGLATNSSNPLVPLTQGRSSGSSIKPLLDYAPAIEYGYVNGSSTLNGNNTTYSDGTPLNNYGNFNYGNVKIGYALGNSLNSSALQVFNMTTLDQKNSIMKPLGIASPDYHQSDSIGYSNISMLQEASAYSALGNDGVRISPTAIASITVNGQPFELPEQKRVRAMSSTTAKTLNNLLQNVTLPNGSEPLASQPQWSGGYSVKSGLVGFDDATTQKINNEVGTNVMPSSDAWLAGTSTGVSVVTWLGSPDLSGDVFIQGGLNGTNEQESNARVYLFNNTIKYMNQGKQITPFSYSGEALENSSGLKTLPASLTSVPKEDIDRIKSFKLPELSKLSKEDEDYYAKNTYKRVFIK